MPVCCEAVDEMTEFGFDVVGDGGAVVVIETAVLESEIEEIDFD